MKRCRTDVMLPKIRRDRGHRRTRQGGRRWRTLQAETLEMRRLLATDLTNREQLLLELVNRARADPLAEAARYGIDLNEGFDDERIPPDPVQPLSPNQILTDVARAHSLDMLRRDFFAHENPDGLRPADRTQAAGYIGTAGENLAWFGSGRFLDRDAEVYNRHEALFLSKDHRVNMLVANYRELGNGIQFGIFDGLTSIMVTENFGNRGGDFFITGVAYTDSIERDDFYTMQEGLGSVTITATRVRDGTTFSTATGAAGGYGLMVPTGVYSVSAQGPGITGTMNVNEVVILNANQKVDFNTRRQNLGSLAGVVFEDLDADGVRDANERLLNGHSVYFDVDASGTYNPDETILTTDSSGRFFYSQLRADDYRLSHDTPSGWRVTTPANNELHVTLAAGEQRSGLEIGVVLENPPPEARDDQFTTETGQPIRIDVFANDTDNGFLVPSETLIFVQPSHGTVQLERNSEELIYTPDEGFVGFDFFEYSVADNEGASSNVARVDIEVTEGPGTLWQNPNDQYDVNHDSHMSSIDALLILNDLNTHGARRLPRPSNDFEPPPYLDVSGDAFISPLDALLVLNELNELAAQQRRGIRAEGEADDLQVDSLQADRATPVPPALALTAAAIDVVFQDSQANRRSRR